MLLIEDDEVDVIRSGARLKETSCRIRFYVAENGVEALRSASRKEERSGTIPKIILLDLNTPKMNGIEFLRELRTDPLLKILVVVVLTTSKDERDVLAAYDYNVAGYVVKPVAFQEFVDALSASITTGLFANCPKKRDQINGTVTILCDGKISNCVLTTHGCVVSACASSWHG